MKKAEYKKLIKLGIDALKKDELQEAANYFESALQIAINTNDILTLGFIYLDLKNFVRAKELFNVVLEFETNAKAIYGLALVNDYTGNKDEAISLYEEAITLEKKEPMLYFDCAYLYEELKLYDKAIDYYEKAILIKDDYFWAHVNLGAIYESLDKNEYALKHFLKAYEIDNAMPMICYNLGVVYSKLGNAEKAEKYYLEELEKESPYKDTFYNLGILYKDSFNDFEKAKQYYLLGIKENENHHLIWYNLGCVYVLLNDYDNAYDCFVYLYYKNRRLFEYIKVDEELKNFRNSSHYKRLMGINP
ncbi:MAG TPA: tetratricopeptide repeat protein [Acholeplasmataceae bacterium]|nr:tetratricopeptide repeat protein [Acholeplasmataceae bacterium]